MPAKPLPAARGMNSIPTMAVPVPKTANPNPAHVQLAMSMKAPATLAAVTANAKPATDITSWPAIPKMSAAVHAVQVWMMPPTTHVETARLRAKLATFRQVNASNSVLI